VAQLMQFSIAVNHGHRLVLVLRFHVQVPGGTSKELVVRQGGLT
jgi:hypothetical protein